MPCMRLALPSSTGSRRHSSAPSQPTTPGASRIWCPSARWSTRRCRTHFLLLRQTCRMSISESARARTRCLATFNVVLSTPSLTASLGPSKSASITLLSSLRLNRTFVNGFPCLRSVDGVATLPHGWWSTKRRWCSSQVCTIHITCRAMRRRTSISFPSIRRAPRRCGTSGAASIPQHTVNPAILGCMCWQVSRRSFHLTTPTTSCGLRWRATSRNWPGHWCTRTNSWRTRAS
mmetsp:Transcript_43723/g.119481  ORF Transcript_43723/g.119481 Transcript_43723/m.119481 type:complete len:233 (+) Transcript_43723:587-1285(+)